MMSSASREILNGGLSTRRGADGGMRPARRIDYMAAAELLRDADEMFVRAEQGGLKLAIIGRTIALVLLGIWLVGSRARDPTRAYDYLLLLAVFVVLGVAHYSLIGTRFDRPWIKYVFITLDIAIVSALVGTQPLYESAPELPSVMMFRTPIVPFYFVILAIAAFSFSPSMVLWQGSLVRWAGLARSCIRQVA